MDGSVFHPPPEVSAALTERLLEAMRRHPDASASALAGVLEISKNVIAGRWSRLGREGVLVKCADGRWRLPTPGETFRAPSLTKRRPSSRLPSARRPCLLSSPGLGCSTLIATSGFQPACSIAADTVDHRCRRAYE
jgi:hypothetical protein